MLDHYFVTSLPGEVDALDGGVLAGWTRTGATFEAYARASLGFSTICGFYLPPGAGGSHFYAASAEECARVAQRFPTFVLETSEAFALATTPIGACPSELVALYRVWNGRGDTNHRYTTSAAVRDAMVARGYVAEGEGPVAVTLCAPP